MKSLHLVFAAMIMNPVCLFGMETGERGEKKFSVRDFMEQKLQSVEILKKEKLETSNYSDTTAFIAANKKRKENIKMVRAVILNGLRKKVGDVLWLDLSNLGLTDLNGLDKYLPYLRKADSKAITGIKIAGNKLKKLDYENLFFDFYIIDAHSNQIVEAPEVIPQDRALNLSKNPLNFRHLHQKFEENSAFIAEDANIVDLPKIEVASGVEISLKGNLLSPGAHEIVKGLQTLTFAQKYNSELEALAAVWKPAGCLVLLWLLYFGEGLIKDNVEMEEALLGLITSILSVGGLTAYGTHVRYNTPRYESPKIAIGGIVEETNGDKDDESTEEYYSDEERED